MTRSPFAAHFAARLCGLLLGLAAFVPFLHAADSAEFQKARALFLSQRYPESRAAFEALDRSSEPNNPRIHYYLGRIAMKRGDEKAAITHFSRATELDPANSGYFAELGGAYAAAIDKASLFEKPGLARKIRAALEHAVELDPENLEARIGLVDYYRQAPSFLGGGMAKAQAQAEEVRARDFDRGTHALARLLVRQKRFADAIDAYEQLLGQSPDNYRAHYAIGHLAAEHRVELERGTRHLRACLDQQPRADEPNHAEVHWRLGQIAEARGDTAAARAAYEAAVALAPGFFQAREALDRLK
ncbi:hypothetical protein AXK11_06415 [Cephaloticoccus primus]|uniref:Uncharacterized protein n=1 Tax=Cephaloticoccus primus TaxID=1548207 RepID=A0A139SLJ3_9BACT|nr:tetratricopeptide repeat protein [Cephaloticoccus primus]KXU35412.1 hypothetical protein AXK11_06415 [Cephaloticoccus primus]